MTTGPKPKCPGCGHTGHKTACKRRKAKSRCVSSGTEDGGTMWMCGYRPPCPCAFRVCGCGAEVALAAELAGSVRLLPGTGEVMIVSVERLPTRNPDGGRLAVRRLPGGHFACRELADGEEPAEGEWRGREHTNEACELLAFAEANPEWLTLRGAA